MYNIFRKQKTNKQKIDRTLTLISLHASNLYLEMAAILSKIKLSTNVWFLNPHPHCGISKKFKNRWSEIEI